MGKTTDVVFGDKSRWFDVDKENIGNIQRKGYFGKDGIQEGFKAAYCGDGFEVLSKDDFEDIYERD